MRALSVVAVTTAPLTGAFASQGPGVGDGTASPELQRGIIFAFIAFFAVIFVASITKRK